LDWQTIINVGAAGLLSAFGWFARQLWEMVQKLKEDIQRLEIDLPTNYVRKADLDARFDKLDASLQRILDKLDQKVDK
jgi:chaperonin cofactor prefoldin